MRAHATIKINKLGVLHFILYHCQNLLQSD